MRHRTCTGNGSTEPDRFCPTIYLEEPTESSSKPDRVSLCGIVESPLPNEPSALVSPECEEHNRRNARRIQDFELCCVFQTARGIHFQEAGRTISDYEENAAESAATVSSKHMLSQSLELPRSAVRWALQCGLTPRSRRGPTANRQARLQVRFIIPPPGLALCRRSRLNSNVRHRSLTPPCELAPTEYS